MATTHKLILFVLVMGVAVLAGVVGIHDFPARREVDLARRAEYQIAQKFGIDSPEYKTQEQKRQEAEAACYTCYATHFRLWEGYGYHEAGSGGNIDFIVEQMEPETSTTGK